MRLKAVAFDLGGTLVRYYERKQFPGILAEALGKVHKLVAGQASVSLPEARSTAMSENKERPDGKVCPLHERVARVFGLAQPLPSSLQNDMATAFLEPIFACARKYEDVDRISGRASRIT